MGDIAIRVDNLGKKYRLGGPQERYQTLRDQIRKWFSPRELIRAVRGQQRPSFWAIKDVSFEVKRGEVLGIVGRNGAGKSTLLKILSRITEPTEGEADIFGRVGSLLEVGTGFNPELTGRENIFLNGAILGMRRSEIVRKFDDIVHFAEVSKFIDTPVKHYSSGMYTRLAFAVAAHLEPEILIVDEVLAVGDAEFQKKCLGKMGEVARGGRTVLFVSHNMGAVRNLCTRAILLELGRVRLNGDTSEVIQSYMATARQYDGRMNRAGRRFTPTVIEIIDAYLECEGNPTGHLSFGDTADVVLHLMARQPVRFSVELILRQQDGVPVAFAPSGLASGFELDVGPGPVTVRCRLPPAKYAAGLYSIDLIAATTGVQFLDYIESGLSFEVEGVAIGERNWAFSQAIGQGCIVWDVQFSREESPSG